jgi:ribosome-associated toxin RatA of RatAB toxin-antitoxin module
MTIRIQRDAATAYTLISAFADYPVLTDAVEAVVVHPPAPDGSVRSEWTVHFRKGLLCWTEEDVFDHDRLTIDFRQIAGDFLSFVGTWSVHPSGPASFVRFEATFDLGIPTLAAILDPVAESTLRENVLRILDGLMGETQLVEDEAA